jgi:exodeoxyribonuclease VII large subunit
MANRLGSSLKSTLQDRRQGLQAAASRLKHASPETRIQIESHKLLSLYKRLEAASPRSVLNRGFAIIRDAAGKPVMRRAAITPGQLVEAEFADGKLPLKAE